jgi:hypothetical protein
MDLLGKEQVMPPLDTATVLTHSKSVCVCVESELQKDRLKALEQI